MRFTALVIKNLTRRPFRSGLTLLAFATAIAAVVALLGISRGFTKSFADVYESHAVDIVVSRQGTSDRLSSSVDAAFAGQIATIPRVARAAGVLMETMSLEEEEVYGVVTMGIAEGSWLLEDYQIERAPAAVAADQNARSLMLGINLADRAEVKAGDTVMMFEEPYLVAGVFESSSAWENGSMIMPLELLQELTDRIGQVTYINVVLEKPVGVSEAEVVIDQIQKLDPKLHALTTEAFVSTDTRMQIAAAMAWMTSMIALVIGAIGTLNTMMTSVMERTREIGILRAIGWPRKRVVTMILMESCALAVVASVVGCLMAAVLTWALSQSSAAKGILSTGIDSSVMLQGFVLALAIGWLGALIPAWRAAQMLPTEAFRGS